jgi:cobalt/nickel transport system permease protein
MGVSAAFVFAAQMLNFPVAGGTSGHLMGGVLASVLLGPSAAVVVLSAVLLVQCFLFNDGGILALGANLFNMAIAGTLGGYAIYATMRLTCGGMRGLVFASAFAAWCSTMLAAVCCAAELAVSGVAAGSVVFPAMMHIHMVIGLGEGLITGMILSVIYRTRPDLIDSRGIASERPTAGAFLGYGLVIALGLAFFASPYASSLPDGLDWVAQNLGFESKAAAKPLFLGPMPDYALPGIQSLSWSTAWAGAIGTLVAFILAWILARALVRRNPTPTAPNNAPPTA